MTREQREQLCRDSFAVGACTLDGQPATVRAWGRPFAVVAADDEGGPAYQWSWEAVLRVMAAGGRFVTQ